MGMYLLALYPMTLMHEPLRKLVSQTLITLIQAQLEAAGVAKDSMNDMDVYKALVEPPNTDLGHLAFGCFITAKNLKKGPPQVSQLLTQELKNEIAQNIVLQKTIASVEAAGPYINIKFTSLGLADYVVKPVVSGATFQAQMTEATPKMMIEYSQPNTHKELHVGHMRNACLGDSIVKLLRYSGYNIIASTFPGDVGTHVAKCLWYMKFHNKEAIPLMNKGEWLGQMYSKGNLKLEDEENTPQAEENKRILTEILKQLEHKSGEYYDLWKETRQWSIDLMNEVYKWADIKFDQWYFESDVDSDSVKTIKKYFSEGKLQESQGAIGLDFSSDNLGFCLLLKSDGTGLYATKDIELARRKFEDYKIQKSIYVVDQRQALHFKQVFKALEVLGFEQAKDCYHLQYNFVELPDGAMSSRKGNIVPLMTLVKTMQAHIKTNYLARYEDWSEEEKNTVADQVAKGAIKYGMLKQDTNKKIVFEMSEWTKLDGESGPFIQYSYARINSLLKKLEFKKESEFNGSVLTHASELKLMQHLMNFNTVALNAAENYKPAAMCSYLYDTAKKFNTTVLLAQLKPLI
jgi:arginyl-tRNA synthetase